MRRFSNRGLTVLELIVALAAFSVLVFTAKAYALGDLIQPCGNGVCLAAKLQETGTVRFTQRVASATVNYNSTSVSIALPAGAVVTDVYFQVGPVGFDGNAAINIGDANNSSGFLATANITKTPYALSGTTSTSRGAYLYVQGTPGADTQTFNRKSYPSGGSVVAAVTQGTAHTGSGTMYVIYQELPVSGTPLSTASPTSTPTVTPTRTPTP